MHPGSTSNNYKMLIYGILAGAIISVLLFSSAISIYEGTLTRTVKIPANELTTVTIEDTKLVYLYNPDSGSLRTNIAFGSVNDTTSAKISVGVGHSWGKWISTIKEITPNYIIIFYEPTNLKVVNGVW